MTQQLQPVMHARPLRVLGIVGSLRAGSYNRRLLEAARALAPAGMRIELFDLADIPLYNGDLDTDQARPAPVERLSAVTSWPRPVASAAMREPTMPVAPKRAIFM